MKKCVLASNNKHKIDEFRKILKNVEILTLNDIGFSKDIEETGKTFLENALIKAKEVSNFLKSKNLLYDVLAEDSGLCCEDLNLEPGIFSARYSGEHGNDADNRKKLIKNLQGKDRSAYFIALIVLYHPDDTYIYKEGRTYGKIIDNEIGNTSFGYDCIFLSNELGKTFGSATAEEKNSVSHRYRALVELEKTM